MNLSRLDHSPFDRGKGRVDALLQLMPVALWAVIELACARIAFSRLAASDLVLRNRQVVDLAGDRDRPIIAQIAFVLPRLAARLPWRADCLIQALAGQSWLLAEGIASRIEIGVENHADNGFGAHAWLLCGDAVVTGGAIERYAGLLGGE